MLTFFEDGHRVSADQLLQ